MDIGGKDFKFYWSIIEFPFYLLLIWTLGAFIISIFSFSLYLSIFSWYSNLVVSLAVFGIAGWSAVKDHKAGVKESAWSGAILGIIIGLVSAVTSILMIYLVPAVVDYSLQQALKSGAEISREMLVTVSRIGAFASLITSPLINGLIGAGIAAVAGLIAKSVGKKS
jgi:hypothetical protein